MPAERGRQSKRADAAANQFVWSSQAEPIYMESPVEMPITYSDLPPPLVDAPTNEFIMFPPPDDMPAPRRQPHSKKKPENHIPRPPNAFILFRSSFIKSQHVSTEVETNHSTLSKIIGLTWQSLPDEERRIWHTKAKEALEEHKRKFPKYAFRPVQTKAKGASSEKRKVREVEPKDIKRCTKIAQLLVEGKKGLELDAAIQEFDKYHVPQIVTRFEAPITARAFRRSSSAPIPDTESSRASQSFLHQVSARPKKFRAASTRPTSPVEIVDRSGAPVNPTVNAHDIVLKEETAFNFCDFSFDNISTPPPMFDCDPLFIQTDIFDEPQFPPQLTRENSYVSDWDPSPSPLSPDTPYMLHGSPIVTISPIPTYAEGFGTFHEGPEKFIDYSGSPYPGFASEPHQPCGVAVPSMCGGLLDHLAPLSHPLPSSHLLYTPFQLDDMNLDLEFSAFMNSMPQPQHAM